MIHVAARVALGPILYLQATRLRRSVPELPEPDGERRGEVGDGAATLRLLVAGDSSAAGVGAGTQEQALAARLSRLLAQCLGCRVRWQVVAQIGLTSAGVLDYLKAHEVEPADLAVVVCGVNDITKEVRLADALRQREHIVRWLRTQCGVRHVALPALPEMDTFPALPHPLAWYAGRLSRRNNRAQRRWASRIDGASHVPMDGVARADLFADDGFHPAPALYERVAQQLADHLQHVVLEKLGPGLGLSPTAAGGRAATSAAPPS